MYRNFTQYWEQKEGVYTQLGVTKEAAHSIWCDCADTVIREIEAAQLKHPN